MTICIESYKNENNNYNNLAIKKGFLKPDYIIKNIYYFIVYMYMPKTFHHIS